MMWLLFLAEYLLGCWVGICEGHSLVQLLDGLQIWLVKALGIGRSLFDCAGFMVPLFEI